MPHTSTPTVDEVVDLLDTVTSPLGFDLPPQLLWIEGDSRDPDTWEFAFQPTGGDSCTEALLGFTAPPTWWALGTLTGGWAGPAEIYDDDDAMRGRMQTRPSSHPDAVRVRSLVVASRDGAIAGRVACADGRRIDEAPEHGFAIDALRRALGLPTAPPGFPVGELLTALWLAEVEAAAADARGDGRSLSWTAVARRHPAMQLLQAAGERPRPSQLVEMASALGRVLSWAEVRRQVTERGWLTNVVSRDLAAWMDEGMLARSLVTALPPVDGLLEGACRRLRPPQARQLRIVYHELSC